MTTYFFFSTNSCDILQVRFIYGYGDNRNIRSGKPRTTHFCGFFSLKNRSMGKKQGPMRTAVEPHSSKNRERFSWFLFFSKYWLKLKIWPACTLDFFQVWNQKICERKRKQTKKKKMTKQGLCEVKAASQQASTDRQSRPSSSSSSSSSASISSSYFFFSFFSFFFPSPLLWFPFLTFSLFVLVLILLNSFLCFQGSYMLLALGKKKTFNF